MVVGFPFSFLPKGDRTSIWTVFWGERGLGVDLYWGQGLYGCIGPGGSLRKAPIGAWTRQGHWTFIRWGGGFVPEITFPPPLRFWATDYIEQKVTLERGKGDGICFIIASLSATSESGAAPHWNEIYCSPQFNL